MWDEVTLYITSSKATVSRAGQAVVNLNSLYVMFFCVTCIWQKESHTHCYDADCWNMFLFEWGSSFCYYKDVCASKLRTCHIRNLGLKISIKNIFFKVSIIKDYMNKLCEGINSQRINPGWWKTKCWFNPINCQFHVVVTWVVVTGPWWKDSKYCLSTTRTCIC